MITKNLLLSCLFIAGVTTQMTMAEDNIVKGTTVGFKHCMKPGAPINITHQSKRVALNEVSDVNITLTTTITSGEMEVEFNLDKNLYRLTIISFLAAFGPPVIYKWGVLHADTLLHDVSLGASNWKYMNTWDTDLSLLKKITNDSSNSSKQPEIFKNFI